MWITISIQRNQKLYFGGEGLFYTTLRSQNRLYTIIAFSRLADRTSLTRAGGDSRGEKYSGGLGNLLDGDNRF
jgi:hypothetical protein